MKKILLGVLGLLVVVVLGASAFVMLGKPSVRPASAESVDKTPDQVARGAYLVEHVMFCMDCHSDRQDSRYGYPPKRDRLGGGGSLCWDEDMGLKGFRLCAPNITPDVETGIGGWTDGEVMRAIREGVNKHGAALFPVMPYTEYASMSDEDVRAVVAYLRSLPPVQNKVPERILPGPLNIIVRLMPKPLDGPVAQPDRNDPVAYGKYLTTVGGCKSCHTPVDEQHRPLPGREFAGGQTFEHKAFGSVQSANITPHATGLANRSQAEFISLFKAFADPEVQAMEVKHENNTVMPWLALAGMQEQDLAAIYAYLRTVPPLDNVVTKRPRPAMAAAPPPQPAAEPEADRAADEAPAATP